MYIQIFTLSVEGISMEETQVLCDECAAMCNRLAGVLAHEWSVNHRTNTISGVMKWSEYEMIAMGTEALSMVVATLHPDQLVPAHRGDRMSDPPMPPAEGARRRTKTGHRTEHGIRDLSGGLRSPGLMRSAGAGICAPRER